MKLTVKGTYFGEPAWVTWDMGVLTGAPVEPDGLDILKALRIRSEALAGASVGMGYLLGRPRLADLKVAQTDPLLNDPHAVLAMLTQDTLDAPIIDGPTVDLVDWPVYKDTPGVPS